ncbi:MAG: hypothetical protein LBH05_04345 [Deferribacteraceae bacterium]|jgi:hypothetical protein|nr:hypothetical protein [Deferribacteraceae bacterium]
MKRFLIVIMLFSYTTVFAEKSNADIFENGAFWKHIENTFENRNIKGLNYYITVSQGMPASSKNRFNYKEKDYHLTRDNSNSYSVHFVWGSVIGGGFLYNTGKSEGYIENKNIYLQSDYYSVHVEASHPTGLILSLTIDAIMDSEKLFYWFSPLMLVEFYISGGGAFVVNTATFEGMTKTHNNVLGYGEFGLRTLEFYHISLDFGYRYTSRKWNSIGDLNYVAGGQEFRTGISLVF